MSVKLYDTDSHIHSFDAVVESCCFDEKRKQWKAELDRTAFFAEGGGQQCDRGTLQTESGNILKVSYVQSKLDEDQKEHIWHFTDEELPAGTRVHGELDWTYRFENMQQHSGEHILSGIMYAKKGYHNVGFHLGDDVTTLDFDGPLTQEEVKELEKEGNEYVVRNLPFTITYPDAETLKTIDYRSKKELSGAIRIVKVGTPENIIDCCACCAPHVMLSGEIGQIKIIRAENYKGGIRLTIVCGSRALRDYGTKHDLLSSMASQLSTSIDHVAASMEKMKLELADKNARLAVLNAELIGMRVEKLKKQAETEDSICLVEKNTDQGAARDLVNALMPAFRGHAAVLLPREEGTWFFIVGSETEDLKALAAKMRTELGSRGGGSGKMIQGTVSGEEETIRNFLS